MKLKVTETILKSSLLAWIIFLISCGGNTNNGNSGNTDSKDSGTKKIKLAFVTNATADFWSYGKAGAEKAASEHDDIEIEFKMGDGTAAKQREVCMLFLSEDLKVSPSAHLIQQANNK